MTEQQALVRLKNGDREALAWIYSTNRDYVAQYFVKNYSVAPAEARELVVDIVMRFDELVGKGKYATLTAQLGTILVEIGKNVIKEHFRKKEKERTDNKEWEEYRDFVENTEGVENAFEASSFDTFLDDLPDLVQNMEDKCANVLHQFYWQNKSDRDIAIQILKEENAIPKDVTIQELLDSPNSRKLIDARTATVKTKRWDCIRKLKTTR